MVPFRLAMHPKPRSRKLGWIPIPSSCIFDKPSILYSVRDPSRSSEISPSTGSATFLLPLINPAAAKPTQFPHYTEAGGAAGAAPKRWGDQGKTKTELRLRIIATRDKACAKVKYTKCYDERESSGDKNATDLCIGMFGGYGNSANGRRPRVVYRPCKQS